MEGTIIWRKNQYMLQYFQDRAEQLYPLKVGDTVEVLINDAWVRTKIGTKLGEPYFVDINYGDGIGCAGRTVE